MDDVELTSTIQGIMMNGYKNDQGGVTPAQTEFRCDYCANDCKVIPEPCNKFQWDFEMKADIFKSSWFKGDWSQ